MGLHSDTQIYKVATDLLSIDKNILHSLIAKRVIETWWLQLADAILFHDPRLNYELRGKHGMLDLVPDHKRLTNHRRIKDVPADELFETANSYFGLFRQATHSHKQRAALSNVLRYRGHAIKSDLTKTYRRKSA